MAERFRQERKRLGMGAVDVAYHCGVSSATVFNWEAGSARIPLSAPCALKKHGFDVDRITSGEEGAFVTVDMYPISQGTLRIPEHLLKRHAVYQNTGLVFHLLSQFEDTMPAGQLCLMRRVPSTAEGVRKQGGIFLLRDVRKEKEILCRLENRSKSRIRIEVGGSGATIAASRLFGTAKILGEYVCGLGFRPLSDAGKNKNLLDFQAFVSRMSR